MNTGFINDTIARLWGKDKCLEARNMLTQAYLEDYAQLQGTGGKDHARSSGIYMVITDSTNEAKQRNGGKGLVVGATVPTDVFALAKSVAEYNLGTLTVDRGELTNAMNILGGVSAASYALYAAFKAGVIGLGTVAKNVVGGSLRRENVPSALAAVADDVMNVLQQNSVQTFMVNRLPIPVYKDWEYSQTRVNTYKHFPDGRVACTTLSMTRKKYQMIGGQEQEQKKPWTVYITSSRVFPNPHQNGTVSVKPGSEVDKSVAFVKMDDAQMYNFARQVCRFEDVWSVTTGWPLISEALQIKQNNAANNNAAGY